jgi:hypothetical protein
MNLKLQVCSFELSERLKELGVEQESYFYWLNDCLDNWIIFHAENDNCNQHSGPGDITFLNIKKRENKAYSAFTVAELGEMLMPFNIVTSKHKKGKKMIWNIYIQDMYMRIHKTYQPSHAGETEADARAKLLIYLLEKKLI